MTENVSRPDKFTRDLVIVAHRLIRWLARHWLAVVNTFFGLYVGLPLLAPLLLASGFPRAANIIYSTYQSACHQLPSRSYFIFGEQVAFCHRDVAIYGAFFVGGLIYALYRGRVKPPELRWYVFFLVPIAVDGGMQLASAWLQAASLGLLWAIGLVAMGIVLFFLQRYNYLTWHSWVFLAFGPLSLLYLQFAGSHLSNWWLRTLTGAIFALGTVWYMYPYLEESFTDIETTVDTKLREAGLD